MTDHQQLTDLELAKAFAALVEEALARNLLMPGYQRVAVSIADHALRQARGRIEERGLA
jgi:hypothetical protein